MSAIARQALAGEVAACRSGRSLNEWLSTLGVTLVNRQPIKVKGKGVMDLSILCPKGVSPSLIKRLSLGSEARSYASIQTSSSKKDLLERELKLAEEVEYLKKEITSLESSLQKSRSDADLLRIKMQYVNAVERANSGDELDAPRRFSESSSRKSTVEPSRLLRQIEELKLQLLVTTKSLAKARQALSTKDEEIDEVQLQLERVRVQLLGRGLYGSVANTERVNSSISTRRSTFMARTQELLEEETPPSSELLSARRRLSRGLSSSLESLGSAVREVNVGLDVDVSNRALDDDLFDSLLLGDKDS